MLWQVKSILIRKLSTEKKTLVLKFLDVFIDVYKGGFDPALEH